MIGLKLPRLFYGRKQRQIDIGVRADFCEFCAVVCRHWVVSFQAAPTVVFVPFKYEEVKRESRCEICRAQFPLADESRFRRLAVKDMTINDLVEETNPDVVQLALIEIDQINNWSSGSKSKSGRLIEQNRLTNFLRRHELDYQELVREIPPFVAVGSIQAAIIGLALAALVKWWLAIAFGASLFALAMLCFFLLLRRKVLRMFHRSALKILAVSGCNVDQLESQLRESTKKFPRSSGIVRQQLIQIGPADLRSFQKEKDFVTLLDKLHQIPEL